MTSYFGDVLQQYMQQNSLRSVDFCTLLRISKSYFSKIKNGTAIPQDFAMITEMADILQLNPDETEHFLPPIKFPGLAPIISGLNRRFRCCHRRPCFRKVP